MNYKPPHMEMFVLSGEQEGARTVLTNDNTLTISGGMDTDVILRDPSITTQKFNLITKDNEVYVQALTDGIEIQGKAIKEGKYIKIPQYSKIKIGNTILSYGKNPNATWKDIREYVSTLELRSAGSAKIKILLMSNTGAYTLSLLIFMILVSFLWLYLNANKQQTDGSFDNIQNIHSLLIENNYTSLSVNINESGQIVISGFLMTNKEKTEVEKLLETNHIPAVLTINTGDRLATEVRELYRVNGLEVEAKPLSNGVVLVTSNNALDDKFNRLKTIALTEISGLTELETEYNNSDQSDNVLIPDKQIESKEKRITMVVDGTPAYLMTSDQAKYYIGAVLPTGHTIISINNHKVVLEKNGLTTTLNF
ncbi:MAG: hypothetical protein ABW101_02145 [Candidatus Thiodiazotropha sp.]